jgi:hypothetical protein
MELRAAVGDLAARNGGLGHRGDQIGACQHEEASSVRADHAPLEGLEIERALASERRMYRRQEHLAQAIALVGIVADRGSRASDGAGELGERTRGQRERGWVPAVLVDECDGHARSSSRGSQRLPHRRASRSEAGVKAAKRRRGALTPRPSGGSRLCRSLRDRFLGGWCGRRHNIPRSPRRHAVRPPSGTCRRSGSRSA